MSGVNGQGLEANLRWYRWHQAAVGALFWLPVAVIYFVDRFGLSEALRLQAVYYLAVVVAEVPTGRFSDRFGRVMTLRLVALSWLCGLAILVAGDSVAAMVGGQVLLAVGFAALSGTDVSFHLDTLEALNRSDEFDRREASGRRVLLVATACAAVVGGTLGLIDLRLPFAAAIGAAAVQLWLTTRLVEPRIAAGLPSAAPPSPIVSATRPARPTRSPLLMWLTAVVVVQVVNVHLVSELAGPYLIDVLDDAAADPGRAAAASGLVVAAVALVGAFLVPRAVAMARRLGLTVTLVAVATVPVALVLAMTFIASPLIVPLLVLRGVQGPVTTVLVAGSVGAMVGSAKRATTLSLMGLSGRLVYGGVLLGLSRSDDLAGSLDAAAFMATALVISLAATSRLVPVADRSPIHDHAHHHEQAQHGHLHNHQDGHHDHLHVQPVDGAHAHAHEHDALLHAHPHTSDPHHSHSH